MVTPRVTRALNPQRKRKLTLKQIRAGFGGKRRRSSLKASNRHTHKRPKAASNPKKKRRRAKAKANPKTRTRVRTRTVVKYKTRKVYVKANPKKRRKATAKRKRSRNPGQYLLTMSPVGNPHRKKRRKSNMAKRRRKVSAKGRSGKRNPTRRRRVARKGNHRPRGSRNPFGQTSTQLLKKGAGVFIGFSIGKNVPPMLGASANSSPTMTLLTTAITAGVAAYLARKFSPGDLAEGVLWGGVGATINMAWNAWAPASITGFGIGVSGMGDFVRGGFPLPQGPVRFPQQRSLPSGGAATPTGSQVNVGAFGRAW